MLRRLHPEKPTSRPPSVAADGSARTLSTLPAPVSFELGTGAPPPGGILLAPCTSAGAVRQSQFQALGLGETLPRLLGQAAQNNGFEIRRHFGPVPRQGLRPLVQVRRQHPDRR